MKNGELSIFLYKHWKLSCFHRLLDTFAAFETQQHLCLRFSLPATFRSVLQIVPDEINLYEMVIIITIDRIKSDNDWPTSRSWKSSGNKIKGKKIYQPFHSFTDKHLSSNIWSNQKLLNHRKLNKNSLFISKITQNIPQNSIK